MAKRSKTGDDLFLEEGSEIPLGRGTACAGCGRDIDLRVRGWATLANHSIVHPGEDCWRLAMVREVADILVRTAIALLPTASAAAYSAARTAFWLRSLADDLDDLAFFGGEP